MGDSGALAKLVEEIFEIRGFGPDGIVVIRRDRIEQFLPDLIVEALAHGFHVVEFDQTVLFIRSNGEVVVSGPSRSARA